MLEATDVVSRMSSDMECNHFQSLRKMTTEKIPLAWVIRDLRSHCTGQGDPRVLTAQLR